MKLKGIVEAPLESFLIFRGFADFEEIARISKAEQAVIYLNTYGAKENG